MSLDAGVEHRHAAVVLDQVDVHRLCGKPPRTTHTPSAIALGLAAVDPRASRGAQVGEPRQPRLGASSRPAAARRAGGRRRRCRRRRRCARSGSSATVTTSQPSRSSRAPLGAKPWNVPGPGERPARAPADGGTVACASSCRGPRARSRGTPRTARSKYSRTPSGAIRSCWPTNRSTPPGAQQRDRRVEVVRGERLEVAPGDRRSVGLIDGAAVYARANIVRGLDGARSVSWGAASGSCPGCGACACRCRGPASRTATRGRSPPATGSCWSTRACTSRARWRSSSGRWSRSACDSRTSRLLVCTHAHSDHWGQAGADLRPRRLRAVDAPQPRARDAARRGSRGRRSRGGWRSGARAACRRRRCAATRSA